MEKEIKNPFKENISFADLLKEIPEKKSIEDYYKGILSENEINILNSELKHYKLTNTKK